MTADEALEALDKAPHSWVPEAVKAIREELEALRRENKLLAYQVRGMPPWTRHDGYMG